MRDLLASLTSRLVVTTVTLVLLVSLVIGTVTTFAMRGYLDGQLDQDVRAALVRMEFPHGQYGHAPPPDRPTPGDIGTMYMWHDAPGDPVWSGNVSTQHSSGEVIPQDLDHTALTQVADLPADNQVHQVDLDGLGSYRVAVATDGSVAAGLPTADVDDLVSNLIWWEALLVLLAVAGAGGAAAIVVRRQLRPLREVAATAHTVAALPLASGEIELAERVPDRLTDKRTEVGQVGSALNTLLAHVESSLHRRHESEQQVRQFVADASHELRTPLTTIAGYTELARRRPDDAATVGTALGKVEEESARMTSMVEDLLLLARLDSGRPLDRRSVDLSRLLVEAVSDARVIAPDHKWQLELPEESIEVTGDEQRLYQVVTNLLGNARKYTPPGTTVTVTVRPGGFSVHDDGPGFPPGLAEKAFERFARGDVSRTRGTDGGAGLGLALVQAIVSAHGGSVSLDSHPGSTEVSVTLP